MNRLARIARSATPSSGVQFRGTAYGKHGVQEFLRDVLAMANADVDGPRYIVTGASFDANGLKTIHALDSDDFSGKPAYQALANDHIEPPLKIRYEPVTVDGKRVGVYEIGDCQDRPYMMRIDYSETLRRGDAYLRVDDAVVKMGRRQLQAMFESKFRDSVSAASIELGFPGEIIHKDRRIATCNLGSLPSTIASTKLRELIKAKSRVRASAANTLVLCRACHWKVHEGGFSVRGEAPDRLTFCDPQGRELTDRFEPPELPADPVAALEAEHDRRGLGIDERSGEIDWWGEPLDLDAAVEALLDAPAP